jgi:hypothetical protein
MTNTRSFVAWDVTAFLILCAALVAIHGANVFVTLAPLGLGWEW